MTLPQLYGASQNPEYGPALLEFAAKHGWIVHPNQQRQCRHLLDNPRHVRNRQDCYGGGWPREWRVDHQILLRRGPAKRPEQWALLSQPYATASPDDLGPAPYGHGTRALLYVGKPLPTT